MTVLRLLANLGYGSRKEVGRMLRRGRVTSPDGTPLGPKDRDPGGPLLVDGAPLDPRPPLTLVLHKPTGVVCTRATDEGETVYDLLPHRFRQRKPVLATVGRLDRDTTGLLLLTDDGQLLHRLTSPRHGVEKVYRATLARPLDGTEAAALAAGTLMLRGESRPLQPASLEVLGPQEVRVTVTEGRYHLVRRMFAALGNHVETLHREAVGPMRLGDDLPAEAWRALTPEEVSALEG